MNTPSRAMSCLFAALWVTSARAELALQGATNRVGAFGRIEFRITGLPEYPDPFDPAVVELNVEFTSPAGRPVLVAAFFAQEYERQVAGAGAGQRDWAYPVGTGAWKARFVPDTPGRYGAKAVLRDEHGEQRSPSIAFECVSSPAKGFVRVSRTDPRFFEFDNGEPLFPIGQNLAFIGEQQHVKMSNSGRIFRQLAENGANYLRIWTCAEDWALAIEARKSAWGRSWSGRGRLEPMPDDPARHCLLIPATNAVQEVNPSHPVALRPSTRYVVTGKVRTEANTSLRLEVQGTSPPEVLESALALAWTPFRHEFTTGSRDWWLGRMRFVREGTGDAWLADVSLSEVGGGAELLWEAELNRPRRGFYNPLDSFWLDEIVTAAEQHGIYLQLCLLTRDLYMNALTDADSAAYDQAIADAKKFFRYAVARWGASTSVAAWEYWNEMDPGLPTDRFYAELGEYLERTDPYGHLRSTSAWGPSPKDCRHPELDLADVHFYLRPADKARLANEVEAVLDRARWLREHAPGKPAMLGEFGLADDRWRITQDMRRIPDLSDMHNALWASALSGLSGTALCWWWERIDQRSGYSNYHTLSRFIADVPWNSGTVRRLEAKCSAPELRVIGLLAGTRAWLWAFDPAASWERVAREKQTLPERRGVSVELTDWQGGRPQVEWWNTRKGQVTRRPVDEDHGGGLRLILPPFRGDIAARLIGPGN